MLLRIHNIEDGNAAEHNLEFFDDMTIETLLILLEDETGISPKDQRLVSKGYVIQTSNAEKTLAECGFKNNDSLVVYGANKRISGHSKYERELRTIQSNAYARSQLAQNNPELADAVRRSDVAEFAALIRSIETAKRIEQDERRALYRRLEENPADEEAQKQIAEMMRLEAVQENLLAAMEHHPEAFGTVTMLYIECNVNKEPVKAFVDSGAQMTIMSPQCAERCNIMRLVDHRWSGMAQGVGTAKILGRVHMVDVNIGGSFLPCSFSILENQGVDMLLGLDMLKRHQCCIDLREGVLRIGTTGSVTPFLPESEIPKSEKQLSGHGAPHSEAAAPGPPSITSSNEDQDSISTLVSMGFPRDQVVNALNAADGNVELAASLLTGAQF